MSSSHLDEHHDVFKEREAKFHSSINNLKEDLDHLQIIHHNMLHVSQQKETEYNKKVSRLNEDIKFLEEDYNELLLVHMQKEKEYNQTIASYEEEQRKCDLTVSSYVQRELANNQTIASYEEEQRKCDLTVSSYVQRELANNQTIDDCEQNVQRLTDALDKQNQSMRKLRQQIKVTSSGSIATGSICTLFFMVLFLSSGKSYE